MLHRAPRTLTLLAILLAAGLLAGCGGGGESESAMDAVPAAAMTTVDPATAGAISGKIMLDGDAPPADAIQMAADPNCARMHESAVMTEFVLTDMEGGLQNAFIYIKGGLEGMSFATPSEPVTLNQEGCVYVPHVLGLQVGQELNILNSDATLHNIHATPTVNQEFNIGQPVAGMSTTRTFDSVEVMVPFKCDVHRWMNSYAGVLDHPYFAVSGMDGSFTIGNVPPGDYTVGVWHERLGEMEMAVTVGQSATADATFTYSAAE
jgi:plastocyanin